MSVFPLSIEKYREPVEVRFLLAGADQLNRSCGRRSLPTPFKNDPRPRTSSISCSVDRRASKVMAPGGRVNEKACAEFIVTIPSYGPPTATCPSANIAGGVFSPTALPAALDGFTFVDKGLIGRLAVAAASFAVFASITSA